MEVKTSSIDILESSELPTAQAHAILKVLEQEMASSQDMLATKADFTAFQAVIRADMVAFQTSIKADLVAFRTDFKSDIAALRAESKSEIAALRAEMREGFLALKADMHAFEGRLSWMVLSSFLVQLGFVAGAVYFLYAHLGK